MARGVQLQQLLTDLRQEIRHSTSSALGQNTRDSLIGILQRTQKQLWEDYDWPFLETWQDKALAAGQRYYDIPTNMDHERINKVYVKEGGVWRKLTHGISVAEYNMHDSDIDERSDPARNWNEYGDGQIEIWPMPDTNGVAATFEGYIRFEGIQNLSDFTSDTDTADLDDVLIVLHAAAEWLAMQRSGDAEAKFQQATRHLNRLRGRHRKRRMIVMGGEEPEPYRPRPPRVE